MEGIPAAWIGWTIGSPLRRVRFIEPAAAPIIRRTVAKPPGPTPVARELPRTRHEVPLEDVPDSWRPLVFAVRLRRRTFDRARGPR